MGSGALRSGRLGRAFFTRPPWVVAPDLLGCVLEHRAPAGVVAVRLVEVEAYAGGEDPASHAWRGRTARNGAMYGPPGTLYVYFVYGMHWCLNVVCESEGTPAAVLLRAGEVVSGSDLVRERRRGRQPWASGPARLAEAMGLDGTADGLDLCAPGSAAVIRAGDGVPAAVERGPRVGVARASDRPWRFWVAGDPAVSAFRPGGRTRRRDAGGSGA